MSNAQRANATVVEEGQIWCFNDYKDNYTYYVVISKHEEDSDGWNLFNLTTGDSTGIWDRARTMLTNSRWRLMA